MSSKLTFRTWDSDIIVLCHAMCTSAGPSQEHVRAGCNTQTKLDCRWWLTNWNSLKPHLNAAISPGTRARTHTALSNINLFFFFNGQNPHNLVWILTSSMFRNNTFFQGAVILAPTPTLEDQKLHFLWPLPFGLSGKDDPTRSLRSFQHSCPGHWGAQTFSPQKRGSLCGGLTSTGIRNMSMNVIDTYINFCNNQHESNVQLKNNLDACYLITKTLNSVNMSKAKHFQTCSKIASYKHILFSFSIHWIPQICNTCSSSFFRKQFAYIIKYSEVSTFCYKLDAWKKKTKP
jgi:hypothetical protein